MSFLTRVAHHCVWRLTRVRNTSYLPWAESNNVIVLFPQAAQAVFHENPEACFDWWGYVDRSVWPAHSFAFGVASDGAIRAQ